MADGQAGQKRQAETQTLTADQTEVAKKWLQLLQQARADKTLKQRLMDTPVVVLQEHGMKVRPGLDIRVEENTDKVPENTDKFAYLTLPSVAQLSDRQLDGVVGGATALEQAMQGAVDAWNNMQNVIGTGVFLIGPDDAGSVLHLK